MKANFQEQLIKAKMKKYAIPAFNFDNLEMLKAIIAGAEEEQAPVIAMATESAATYMGFDYTIAIGKIAVQTAKVPVILHWDHGYNLELVKKAITAGYDSVMLDASLLPIEENIAQTKIVVELAHKHNVGVESEIGHVGGKEDDTNSQVVNYTKIEDALYFNKQTKIDCLAIAVGNAHGVYHGEVKLQFDLIKKVSAKLSTPLVLHGSSGINDKLLIKAIGAGISKVNIGTDLKIAYSNALRTWFETYPDGYDARKFGNYAIEQVKKVVKDKIKILGASHQAF